jgi:hypothetical protein
MVRAQSPATPITGFLDVPWGATVEEAKKIFPKRSGARLDRTRSTDAELRFVGGKFAGMRAHSFYLQFVNGRFWKADARVENQSAGHEAEFATLKKMMTEKYGPAVNDNPAGTVRVLDWSVDAGPGLERNHLALSADPKGDGAVIMYACDRVRKEGAQAGPKSEPGKTPKPIRVGASAKDDL